MLGHATQVEYRVELGLVIQIDRGARDVAGVVRDAFEYRRHFRDRDDEPQIARGGLAQGDDVDALAIDLDLEMIDLIVVIEYLPGDLAIELAERIPGTFES